ncbi:hypothetical protein CEXT_377681 [Caerostris extrusa]|uniref:Uncharacterized protein n=1 Tax=Caerostris extrusa TaxID=172846 RepID=A0AAV4S738_CAEEX|nr:hypothetical protein CEXT_377681 [Caerostris extrusa]
MKINTIICGIRLLLPLDPSAPKKSSKSSRQTEGQTPKRRRSQMENGFVSRYMSHVRGGQVSGNEEEERTQQRKKIFQKKKKIIPVIALEGSPSFNRCHINLGYSH